MYLQPITDSVIDLNFMPLNDINDYFPSIVVENCRIAGFKNQTKALYLEEPLDEALKLYEKLSLPELARLYSLTKKNNIQVNWEKICSNNKLKMSENLEMLFVNLSLTKLTFQNWVSNKDCGLGELQILNWAAQQYSFEEIDRFLNKMSSLSPSRNDGVKILEWGLHNLKKIDQDFLFTESSVESILKKLYELQYPENHKKDEEFKIRALKIPWPSHIKVNPMRKEDYRGIEIRFFVQNYSDYTKKIDGLHNLKEKVNKELWNQN